MKEGYLKKEDRKKILFLCDDITTNSGIGTMAREIVVGCAHKYNWVCVGAAINHPQAGQKLDFSSDISKLTEIEDASVISYPNNGYGDAELIRKLIKTEKPDAIMMFTDPRYFIWLFQIEDEIRNKIPLLYYTIWDDLPAPYYNSPYYESCDGLFCISKQTENIVKHVLKSENKWDENKVIKYMPHGINENQFYPITQENENYEQYKSFKKHILGDNEYDFVVFWNSRNIHRKHPGDVILAFQQFVSNLPKDKAKRCVLIMHTQPIDSNGTDLLAVKELIGDPEYCNIVFSDQRLGYVEMNYLYNMADITMLISSNEGWGLSLTESLLTGTMILANVTGGMQDQMRFEDEEGNWIKFNDTFLSNHFGTYKKHGEWAIPVFPNNMSLAGSVPTPYIYDDRVDFREVASKLLECYNLTLEERIKKGLSGRKWATGNEAKFTADEMCKSFIENADETFTKFKPRPQYTITKIKDKESKLIKHPLVY
jgi:glycosyltransferase involved in cell wall biosynthesis